MTQSLVAKYTLRLFMQLGKGNVVYRLLLQPSPLWLLLMGMTMRRKSTQKGKKSILWIKALGLKAKPV